MSILATALRRDLKEKSDPSKARGSARFFKCGKGQYGEGDRFLGIIVPEQRSIAKKYFQKVTFNDIEGLLNSSFHEYRLTGLLMLVYRFERVDKKERTALYRFYLRNRKAVNNWDLVDVTTPNIIGEYLWDHPDKRTFLHRLVMSKNLWERRMAIVATFAFIKKGRFEETLHLAEVLLGDTEDLLHKATGWMLREVGKRDVQVLKAFLEKNASRMPRTMLRYAIEKFDTETRKSYLNKKQSLQR